MVTTTRATPDTEEPGGASPPETPGAAVAVVPPRRNRLVAIGLPVVLLLVAGVLRFAALTEPERIYFDETYYAEDANEYLTRGVEEDFAVHPPLGKWLLAAGIGIFGYDALGWRAGAAAAGTLTVLMLYLAGLRLFRRRGIAALAALLLAVDGLAFTMSRIAMLDVFLALFVVAGFLVLLIDRDRQWRPVAGLSPPPEGETRPLPRHPQHYRVLAGVIFGLALASKWSALLAIGAAGLFVLFSEVAWRRRVTGRWLTAWWRIVVSGVLTLLVVPALVYVVSYAGWFANYENTRPGREDCAGETCNVSAVDMVGSWWEEQGEILHFHLTLEASHPYRASALTWPTLYRPVAYYYESCKPNRDVSEDGPCVVDEGNVSTILGIGNPGIWWPALGAYLFLAFFAVVRRDWRAWAIWAFLLAQYVPWLFATRPVFLFYATPLVPFMCLALAYVAWRAVRRRHWRWAPAAIAVVAVAGFLWWYPLYSAMEISEGAWRLRILMDSWI